MKFYDSIATQAEMGVVTYAHFVPFVGYKNWLALDRADIPDALKRKMGMVTPQVICKFRVDSVDSRRNSVRILILWSDPILVGTESTLMDLPADELAIRICES